MEKSKIYDIFFKQDKICYSKDYKEFEEVYEELKDILNLKKEIDNSYQWSLVIITKRR